MNVTGKKIRAFVGAMKIARNLAVSGRHVEWHPPLPAPSLRELSSEARLRECTSMNVNGKKITEPIMACGKTIGPVEPSDDTPSVSPCGLTAPSEREPGNVPIHRGAC